MALNPDLLRASFDLVVAKDPNLTQRFYEILFERYPQAEPLFRRSPRPAQARMLAQALAAVLDHLDDAAWLSGTLGAMGARHVGYGVTDDMYGWVGDALIATLAETAGDAWTAELEAAWVEAYGAITGLMLAGARNSNAA